MDITEFNAALLRVQDGQTDLRQQFVSEIQRLQSNIQKDVVSGSQGYIPIPTEFQQRSAFQMQSYVQISDYDDIIKQLIIEYSDQPTMRELMLSQLKKEQKYINLPKYPEFYSDYIQGEILHNLNTPITSPESVMTFLLEDEHANIQTLKQQVLSCINQLRYSMDQSKLTVVAAQLKQFFAEVRRSKDVIERIYSTSTAAFVKIPDDTLKKIQECGLEINALNRGPSYLTYDDFKNSLYRHLNNISSGQVLKLYVEHVQLLRRGHIINETMKLAGQLLFFKPQQSSGTKNIHKEDFDNEEIDELRLLPILVSKDLPSLLDQILNCEDFVDQFQLKDKFQQLLNVQLSGEVQQAIDANLVQQDNEQTRLLPYNFQRIIAIILSQLSEEKKIYGRSITQETLAAKLKACSHTYFKNLKFYFIQFFKSQKSENEQDFNDIFDVIDAADRKAEHYEVVNLEHNIFADLCVTQEVHDGIKRQFNKFFYENAIASQEDDQEPKQSVPSTTNVDIAVSGLQNSVTPNAAQTGVTNGLKATVSGHPQPDKGGQSDPKSELPEHAASVFAWRDRLRSFDSSSALQTPNDKLTILCGLLVSITPQQREVLGEKYVEESIKNRLAVWNINWCGKADQIQQQLTQVAEFVRFVDVNRLFSKMQEYATAIFYYIQETKRLQVPINIFSEYGEAQLDNILDFVSMDNVDSIFKSNNLKEFLQKVTNNDFNWDKEWNDNFYIEEYKLRNRKTSKQVIYQQAINYCQDLLYECNRVLSAYIEQVEKQLRRDYLLKTAYESDRFKIMHKDMGSNEIKEKLMKMDNNQLLEYFTPQDIEHYRSLDFGSLIDITGIFQQYLKLETQFLYHKFQYIRYLFSYALHSGIQNVQLTVQLQLNKFLYRPENMFEFAQARGALQEQGLFGADPLVDRPMLEYLSESVAQVNSPLYILKLSCQTVELENSVIEIFEKQEETLIELQKKKRKDSNGNQDITCFKFYEGVNLSYMLQAIELHIQDLLQIFTQEAYPHLFEHINCLRDQSVDGEADPKLSAYPGSGAIQYQLKIPICLRRCYAEQIGIVVLQQMMQMQGNSLHTLPQHYQQSADLGQLQYPQRVNFILEQAIKQLKIKIDSNQQVNERVTSYGPERMVNSLLGLLSSQSVASQAETLRFRDFYQICEQGKKDQLDQYIGGCLFYTYDGVGALPLPFLIISRLHNLIHAKQRLQIEYVRSEILRKSTIRLAQSCQNSKAREDILTLYTRGKVTGSSKKQDYRQQLGPKLLQNALPYMCSIDDVSCKYILQQHDPYSTQNLIDILILTDADISASVLEKPINFSDVLPTDVTYPALNSVYQPGNLGILTRVSCLEKLVNEIKFLNLQSGLFSMDYALTNQAIRGELQAQLSEQQTEECLGACPWAVLGEEASGRGSVPLSVGSIRYEYHDIHGYLSTSMCPQLGALRVECPSASYSGQQSTLYFEHPEDTLYRLGRTVEEEYEGRLKQYQAKEVTAQLRYVVSQAQIFVQTLHFAIEFARRYALYTQLRVYLRELRTRISRVDASQHPFALEAAPQYRGVTFSAADFIQAGFFLDDDGRVGHLSSIPHPALVSFSKFTVQMLEIVLFYTMNLRDVLQFFCLKQRLLGRQEQEYQIGNAFEFLHDIAKIQIEDEDPQQSSNIVWHGALDTGIEQNSSQTAQSLDQGTQQPQSSPAPPQNTAQSLANHIGLIIPSFVYLDPADLRLIKGAVDIPLSNFEGSEPIKKRQQRLTAQNNLENVKIRLILSKLVLLRDCFESLQAAVYLQCYRNSIQKQHKSQEKYFKRLLNEKLTIKDKFNVIVNDNDVTEAINMQYDGYRLSKQLINNAEARAMSQNLNTNFLQHQQQIEVNKFYAGSGDQIQTHQYYNIQILTGCTEVTIKPIKEQIPAKFPYISIKVQQNKAIAPDTSQSSLSIPLPYLTYTQLKNINLTEIHNFIQLQKLGVDQTKTIVRHKGQLPSISYNHMQNATGYSFCRYINLHNDARNNLSYDSCRRVCIREVLIDNEEIIPQFFSTINQVLTQIELDSVFLNSILTALSNDKSQFNQSRYQLFICQNILNYNKNLSILHQLGLKRVNFSDFIGQKSAQKVFKQMFDKYIKQMPQPGSGHNLNNQQVIANINAKKKQQMQFLQENFFEFVDEKNIEALFISDDCQSIRESLYYMQYIFSNLFQQNLTMFQQFQLLQFIREKNQMMEFKINFQEKFNTLQNMSSAIDSNPEATDQFIAYQDNVLKLGQYVCQQLQQYCKLDATLNPFNSNVTSQLTPQIISVFNGINQFQSFNFKPGQTSFQNSQRLAGVKAMLSILHTLIQKDDTSKLTNLELRNYNNQQKYLNDVINILTQQQNLFYSFIASKMLFELKRYLVQDFEKYQLYTNADDKNQLLKIFKTSTNQDAVLLQQQIYGFDIKSVINQLNRLYNNIYNPCYNDVKAYQDEQNYDRLKVYGHISIYNQSVILNQQLPKSMRLQQQIVYKSIFNLYNQANLTMIQQISQRQRELHYVMNQLVIAEDMQRQNIHNTYQTKFLTVLAAIISIQELQKIFEQSKNDISNQSVDEIKMGYQKIQAIQDQLLRFCICKNYTPDFLAGLKDVQVRYDELLGEYDAFEASRQNIVQNYNSSIKLTKDNLADVRLRSLMSRNYLNNIIKYKSELLAETAAWTNDAISGYSRTTYQLLAEIQTSEEELEKQINVVQQIINEKTASVLEMKDQLVNSKKTRQGAGSTTTKEQAARVQLIKEQANQIVQNNFQGKKPMKTLPILANNGLQKAYKICNEGEELVAVYRQKLLELEALRHQKSKLEENIRLNANFYINEQSQYKREINKEKEIIRQAQAQQTELAKSNAEFLKQIQLAQRLQQENTKMMYNNKIQKLHDERKRLGDEEAQVNLKIEKLFNNPKHRKLFEAVGENMDQVLTYFEQINNRGIGSRATTGRGARF